MNDQIQSGGAKVFPLAIVGFILSFFCGLVGLILSIIAKAKISSSGGALTGGGFALAGIIVGGVVFLIQVAYAIIMAGGGIQGL